MSGVRTGATVVGSDGWVEPEISSNQGVLASGNLGLWGAAMDARAHTSGGLMGALSRISVVLRTAIGLPRGVRSNSVACAHHAVTQATTQRSSSRPGGRSAFCSKKLLQNNNGVSIFFSWDTLSYYSIQI